MDDSAAGPSSSMEVEGDESSSGQGEGGLSCLMHMVLGGLVGATPHMMSASVMALARLTYEFAARLEAWLPQMLPATLLLLRSRSRELVKAVLGLVKVGGAPGYERGCLEVWWSCTCVFPRGIPLWVPVKVSPAPF